MLAGHCLIWVVPSDRNVQSGLQHQSCQPALHTTPPFQPQTACRNPLDYGNRKQMLTIMWDKHYLHLTALPVLVFFLFGFFDTDQQLVPI